MHLQFVESESTFANFHATRAYLEAWGKPVAFYSDKHGVFRVNQRGALGGDGMTQFGRALRRVVDEHQQRALRAAVPPVLAAVGGAQYQIFRHNDPVDLENRLVGADP